MDGRGFARFRGTQGQQVGSRVSLRGGVSARQKGRGPAGDDKLCMTD